MNLGLRLAHYLRRDGSSLAAAYVCMLVLALTTAFYAFLAGPALNYVFSGNIADVLRSNDGSLRPLWRMLPTAWINAVETLEARWALFVVPALIVVTSVAKGVAQTGQFFLLGRISQRILKTLRAEAFGALLRQPPAFYERRAHGDLVSRLTHDAGLVEQAFFYGAGPIFRDTLGVVVLLGFCFYVDVQLALVTFIVVPLAIVPLVRFARWLKRVSRRGQVAQGEINSVCYESLAGVRVVQAFAQEAHEQQRLETASLRYYAQMLRSYFIRAVRTPTMETLGALAMATLLGTLGYYVQTRHLDAAHYVSFFVAIIMMYDPLKQLGRVSDFLATGAAAAERIFEVIDLPPAIADKPHAIALPPFTGEVTLEGVRFAYEEPNHEILRGIDLHLRAGEVVALVGASGSGKSTLAQLLPRFYDVSAGSVRVDGHDVRDVTLASLRAQISFVGQDTFLFNASVRDNIAYGAPHATDAAVQAAAAAAYATEFIERLPARYDTVIGERGVTLSGGQRQRLAIARALLRDTPLLVLDEATSSLDVESERYVQRALDRLMQGRTSLVIAHRLSTVRNAHVIAVLQEGRIVERGTHDALLLQQCGEYARLYALQFVDSPARGQQAATRHDACCAAI